MFTIVEHLFMFSFNYSRTSCFMLSFNYSRTSCFMFNFAYSRSSGYMLNFSYSRTSCSCSVLTTVYPLVYVQC